MFQETVQDGGSGYPNTQITRESPDDAVAPSSIARWPTITRVEMRPPTTGAPSVVVRERCGSDRNVGTGVE